MNTPQAQTLGFLANGLEKLLAKSQENGYRSERKVLGKVEGRFGLP